jgi:exopolysaccharide biosynthesis polyprenyl glycosylphosphotransferase
MKAPRTWSPKRATTDGPTADHVPTASSADSLRAGRGMLVGRIFLRYGVRPLLLTSDILGLTIASVATGGVTGADGVMAVLMITFLVSGGLYRSRLSLSALDDLPAMAGRAIIAGAIATSVASVLGEQPTNELLVTAAVAGVVVPLLRACSYAFVRWVRARRVIAHPTVILGAGVVGARLAELLLEHPEYGLLPVGFLDSDPLLPEQSRPIALLGGHDALAKVIVEFGVHDVIVAFGSARGSEMVSVIRTCDRLNVEIFFVPRLFELMTTNRDTDHIWGVPVARLRRAAFRSPMWKVKRLLDVVAAGLALILLSPVLLVCAVATRFEGGQGVIFRQVRVGIDGRRFNILKFRSMSPGVDTWVLDQNRIGPVGRIMRKTSLDELPQLWNIIRGDMTLVGPRPDRPQFVAKFSESYPRYTARHRVPAGLTGWAQVHGLRGDTSIEERAQFDNFYIENWSLWSDFKIIVRTIGQLVKGSGG